MKLLLNVIKLERNINYVVSWKIQLIKVLFVWKLQILIYFNFLSSSSSWVHVNCSLFNALSIVWWTKEMKINFISSETRLKHNRNHDIIECLQMHLDYRRQVWEPMSVDWGAQFLLLTNGKKDFLSILNVFSNDA